MASDNTWPAAGGVRFRADLAALPRYKAGGRPAGDSGRPSFSLASNESHHPPSEAMIAAITEAARDSHRYPDPMSTALVAALADHTDAPAAGIGLGTGSVALCQQAVTATAGPGDEIVYAWRSFEAYPIITGAAGATAVPVPLLPDGRHDLDAMAGAVTDRTRAVFLCTPNNPTGPILTAAEVAGFVRRVPEDLLVVIDEAYREFVTDPVAVDGVEVARRHGNVVALRTLSKAYGLAGLRVGYGVGAPEVMATLRSVSMPFGVSRLAEAAGLVALAEADLVAARVRDTVAQRDRVRAELLRLGFPVPQAQGNFVWLPLGDESEEFVAACAAAGLAVRGFPGDGVRVTVAEPDGNDAFLAVAAQWAGGGSGG